MPIKPSITVLTLGVDDLNRAFAFYREGLGFPSEGILGADDDHGGVAFFDLNLGLKLALWSRADIANDARLKVSPAAPTNFTIGHNVRTRGEVDEVMQRAIKSGAKLVKHPQDTFWGGYAGYFQDPEGHLWEVVWNPHLMPAE